MTLCRFHLVRLNTDNSKHIITTLLRDRRLCFVREIYFVLGKDIKKYLKDDSEIDFVINFIDHPQFGAVRNFFFMWEIAASAQQRLSASVSEDLCVCWPVRQSVPSKQT